MYFDDELKFEKDLINLLTENGWEKEILKYKTEEDLLDNWANILFENNNTIDRLNNCRLTRSEMNQILEQINSLRTPLKLNGFINGRTIIIRRDNPDDVLHFNKEISLKIYDRDEIAAGQSRYQIAEQPIYKPKGIYPSRRGDFVLLINGMPLIHVELKKSGIPVIQACNQIEKYAHEGVFTGLFSLVQIFVAMNPEETLYFANPGPDGKFNKDYYFHWADFNNEHINDYQNIARTLLHIPTAHQLIGFYTVADNTDGILKVMRSYQYYAANGIADKVSKIHWDDKSIYGGYIWHTTGSGKTMTSFKSATLIANSKDADKVVFLMDRIELGTQSLLEYRNFADDLTDVQETEDTYVLLSKLKSNDPKDTLIVTSIQKMSNIKEESAYNQDDITKINGKRIVFVVDECHRSTFGEMLSNIKITFPRAIFFGFTGTPIHMENKKKDTTTAMIFGNEIHRYSIADGIRDKNVLGFDPIMVSTYKENDLRVAVGLDQANATSIEEVYLDDKKKEIFEFFMDREKVKMAGFYTEEGKYINGIEDFLSNAQYDREEHFDAVIKDILDNWIITSKNGKYHAILATSSIQEAVKYYNKLKLTNLKVTAVFDQNIDNSGNYIWKEDAVVEIIQNYNKMFSMNFTMSNFKAFKKDVCLRLAHKDTYKYIKQNEQLDLLIVVDQMLTGYDSKWINTLFLDKILKYEGIIQAFSRTNRLNGVDKPHGIIKWYRKPFTMEKNVNNAFKLYSGDKPFGLFVDKLNKNIKNMNHFYEEIKDIFISNGINNFESLPTSQDEKMKFASLFKSFNSHLEAAKIQGFYWGKSEYYFKNEDNVKYTIISLCTYEEYMSLLARYKELQFVGGAINTDIPYDLDTYLTEINAGVIDSNWLNERFKKYLIALQEGELVDKARTDISKAFASLSQEQQKYANILLHDIEMGTIKIVEEKSINDYISEYQSKAKEDQIHVFSKKLGLDENLLREMIHLCLNENNINEFGRFDKLKSTVDINIAKIYFEDLDKTKYPNFKIIQKVDALLRDFITKGGYEI